MDLDIGKLVEHGFSMNEILEGAVKIKGIIPILKKFLPQLAEMEKTFGLLPDEKIIYSLVPTPKTLKIVILVLQDQPDGSAKITSIKNQFDIFVEVEKFTSLIPDVKLD